MVTNCLLARFFLPPTGAEVSRVLGPQEKCLQGERAVTRRSAGVSRSSLFRISASISGWNKRVSGLVDSSAGGEFNALRVTW